MGLARRPTMRIHIDHYHYHADTARLERIEARLGSLIEQGKAILMAIDAQTQDLLNRYDAATTQIGEALAGIGADITRLLQRPDVSMSAETREAFEGRLNVLQSHAQGLTDLDAEHVPDMP